MSNAAVVTDSSGIRTLEHVSPSQVKTFLRCPRLWYFEKVDKLSSEGTGAQNLGTEVHLQQETWARGGAEPTHPSAKLAVQWLNDRGGRQSSWLVEADVEGLLAAGVAFTGRMDLVVPPDSTGTVYIWDWKTTSDMKYAKTLAELRTDVQMGSYAHWAYTRWPNCRRVRVAHGYMHTKRVRGQFKPVMATVSRLQAKKVWDVVEWAVVQMKLTMAVESAKQVTGAMDRDDGGPCSAFGGCAQFSRCWSLADVLDGGE